LNPDVLDPVVQRQARDVVAAGATTVVNVVWGRRWMRWWRDIFFLTLCEIFAVRCNAAHGEQMFCGFLVHAFLCRASIFAHGKGHLAVRVRKSARQTSFTVQNATVCPLPCVFGKNARQRVCRAFLAFCRAPETHGKGLVSRSGQRSEGIILLLPPHAARLHSVHVTTCAIASIWSRQVVWRD
jgi:hypothetical protein